MTRFPWRNDACTFFSLIYFSELSLNILMPVCTLPTADTLNDMKKVFA